MKIDGRNIEHAWAHGLKERGRYGNVSFDGPDFYSYGTIIARVLVRPKSDGGPGVVALNVTSYSKTTNRHQFHARHAIPSHWPIIRYHGGGFYMGGSGSPDSGTVLVRAQWNEAKKRLLALKHPTEAEARADVAALANLQAAARLIGGTPLSAIRRFDLDAFSASLPWAAQAARWAHALEVSRRRSEGARKAAETRRKEEERRWGMSWEERQAEDASKVAERLELWRRGRATLPRTHGTTFLRLKGENVECSNGPAIPVTAARLVWAAWQGGRLAPGMHAGPYTVREVAPDYFVAGCTRIDRAEAERIAPLL